MWTSTDQKWDSAPKTHKELSQKKQFLKPNGTDLRVSGILKENPTVRGCSEQEIILNVLIIDDKSQVF
jgi:hypothetical protein